jgi:hypothetical protein
VAGANPTTEVAQMLAKAEQLLEQAQDALRAGDAVAALRLASESMSISAKLAMPRPQPPEPAKVVEEAAAWLNRARTSVGANPSAEAAQLLAKAEQLLKQAQDALRAGDSATALKLASESIGISRKLTPTTRPADKPAERPTDQPTDRKG